MAESDLIFLFSDLRDPECRKAARLLAASELPYIRVPCSGIYEPQVVYRKEKVEGLDRIKRFVGRMLTRG